MSTRIVLEDGRWFALESARAFAEAREFDGRNMISLATGSQWDHETLYRTKGGRWVLNHWSQWQGSRETYAEISDEEAAAWLVRNQHTEPGVPATDSAMAALEVA